MKICSYFGEQWSLDNIGSFTSDFLASASVVTVDTTSMLYVERFLRLTTAVEHPFWGQNWHSIARRSEKAMVDHVTSLYLTN